MEQQEQRHDGTSPLPFAMDWSHPPFEWNGRDTVWPQDSHIGWRYCVTVPSWLVAPQATNMNPVMFYRVQVALQSPKGVTTTRTTLRMSNDFLELRAALHSMFPSKNLPPIPPKQIIRVLNWNLLEKRRRTVEDWIITLLSDIDVSRSIAVASFFELESAATSAFQARGFSNMSSDGDLISKSDESLVLPLDQQQKMKSVDIHMERLERLLVIAKSNMDKVCLQLKRLEDLQNELDTTKQKNKYLQQAFLMERKNSTKMQQDMDELQRKSLEMELKLKSQQGDITETGCLNIPLVQEKDELLQELDVTKNRYKQLIKKHQELEAKSKLEIMILVKEVKSLRSSQANLKDQLNESLEEKSNAEKLLQQEKQKFEKEKAVRMKLIHDCEVLHNRLLECRLPNENEDSFCRHSSSLQSAFKLLQISDYRIETLLAEAHFLSEDDKLEASAAIDTRNNEDGGMAVDHELKNLLSRIIIDNITLRKIVSSVVRYAIKLTSS